MSLLAGVPAALEAALPAEIPSPSVGVWHLGPLPIRGYALCILAGIVVAVWLTQKRLEARGHRKGVAIDISAWAVPFGTVGAWIGCRKNGVAFRDFVDAAAPGLAIAQAMGRFGNWFNNEIYGG